MDTQEVERLVKWLQEDTHEIVMTMQSADFLLDVADFLAEVHDILKDVKPDIGVCSDDIDYLSREAERLRIGLETDCDPTKAIDRLSENVDRLAKELHIEY